VVAAAEGRPSPAVWIQRLQWGLVNRRMFELAAALRGPEAMLAGATWDDIVDVTVFLTDMAADFPAFNKLYAEHFATNRPTTLVATGVSTKRAASGLPL